MDYYKILGIKKRAKPEEIKKAYRKLANKYHPDKSKGDDTKFKEINQAYTILIDAEKKSFYDKYGVNKDEDGKDLNTVLKQAFDTIINHFSFNENEDNIIDILNKEFTKRIEEGEIKKSDLQQLIKKYNSIKSRFKGKKETVRIFKEHLDEQIKISMSQINELDKIKKYIDILIKMINGVKYETGKEEASVQFLEDLKDALENMYG